MEARCLEHLQPHRVNNCDMITSCAVSLLHPLFFNPSFLRNAVNKQDHRNRELTGGEEVRCPLMFIDRAHEHTSGRFFASIFSVFPSEPSASNGFLLYGHILGRFFAKILHICLPSELRSSNGFCFCGRRRAKKGVAAGSPRTGGSPKSEPSGKLIRKSRTSGTSVSSFKVSPFSSLLFKLGTTDPL